MRVFAVAVGALFLVACSNSTPGTTASSSRTSTPTGMSPSGTKAADLRTRLDLLLGEHVILVAKQSVAAAAHTEEYSGYVGLLAVNTSDLADVMRSAFGNTAATRFNQVWQTQNGYLVDYTIGLVTHNQDKSNGASSGLVNGFVPQFAQVVGGMAHLPVQDITQLVTRHVLETKAVIDDDVAQNYSRMYIDLRTAYLDTQLLGDALAARTAHMFPDKFPGDPSLKQVDVRVAISDMLQEEAYVATMASDAVTGNRAAEQTASNSGLAQNALDLAGELSRLSGTSIHDQFQQLWATRDDDFVAYAKSADTVARQRLTDTFVTRFAALAHAPSKSIRDQVLASIKVIDDQRSNAFAKVAGDDRAAATAMQQIADAIAASGQG